MASLSQVKQKGFQKLQPLSHDTPIDPTKLRCVCMSDTHNRTARMQLAVPEGDIFIHAGDFSMVGRPREIAEFNEFLGMCKIAKAHYFSVISIIYVRPLIRHKALKNNFIAVLKKF